jgi:hypothetical protein
LASLAKDLCGLLSITKRFPTMGRGKGPGGSLNFDLFLVMAEISEEKTCVTMNNNKKISV